MAATAAPRSATTHCSSQQNLAFYPKKRFHIFDSIAKLVIFQMISSIRASSLVQKYGLVRMLFWVGDDDKNPILPRNCQRRRRAAVDGELSTDWIMEVAGLDADDSPGGIHPQPRYRPRQRRASG